MRWGGGEGFLYAGVTSWKEDCQEIHACLSGRLRIPVERGGPKAAREQVDPGPLEYHRRFLNRHPARRSHDHQSQNHQVYRNGERGNHLSQTQ
jgi:hypothetical protein